MSKRHRGQAAKEHGFSDLWRWAAIFLLKDSQTTETSMPTWTITQIIVMKAERGYSEIAWVTISTCTCHRLEFKISVLNNRLCMLWRGKKEGQCANILSLVHRPRITNKLYSWYLLTWQGRQVKSLFADFYLQDMEVFFDHVQLFLDIAWDGFTLGFSVW